MNLSCIIIDDEPNAVNLLEMFIHQSTGWELRAKCYDALEAMAFLKQNRADFVFLDINMPQLSGMELAALLPKETRIVFTTAYSEYAVDSYSFSTIDYLLKPITLKRFLTTQQKIEAHFGLLQSTADPHAIPAESHAMPFGEYFFVKSGKVLKKILLEDILYFEGEKEYVHLITSSENILVYRRMKEVEEQLTLPFIRIHNSYVINIRQIRKIQDNHVYITDKPIPVSDKYREYFMTVIQAKLF
jgi:two-component system LytT family response regulator